MPGDGQPAKNVKCENEKRKRDGKKRRGFVELLERSKGQGKQKKRERQRKERLYAAKDAVHERRRVWRITPGIARNPIDADPMTKQKRDTHRTSMVRIIIATDLIGLVMKPSSLAVGDLPLHHRQMIATQPATAAHLDTTLTHRIRPW